MIQGQPGYSPPLLSVHNYNQFFIKTKQEGATGDSRDTRGSWDRESASHKQALDRGRGNISPSPVTRQMISPFVVINEEFK